MQRSLVFAMSAGISVGGEEKLMGRSRSEMDYLVASQCRCLGLAPGCFPPFVVRGMTYQDDRVDTVLKSIVNRAANKSVLYV